MASAATSEVLQARLRVILSSQPASECQRGEMNLAVQTVKTLADTLGVKMTDLLHGF